MAVVGAVATAVATAGISFGGDVVHALFGSEVHSAPTVQTSTVSSVDGSLSLTVPVDWNQLPAEWDLPIDHVISPGPGLRAGIRSGLTSFTAFDDPSVYFAASRGAANEWNFRNQPRDELVAWTRSAAEAIDWSRYFCNRSTENVISRGGWVGTQIAWDSCLHHAGNRHWEIVAVEVHGAAVMNLALSLPPTSPKEVAGAVLGSWTVQADALPLTAGRASEKGSLTLPRPAWEKGLRGDLIIP